MRRSIIYFAFIIGLLVSVSARAGAAVLEIVSPPDGTTVSSSVIPVVGNVSDLSISAISLNGVEVLPWEGTWAERMHLDIGANVITATAVDGASNVHTATATVNYDPNASSALFDIITPSESAVVRSSKVLVTATLANKEDLYININGTEYLAVDGALIARVPVNPGSNLLEMRCHDRAGAQELQTRNITFDTSGLDMGGVIANNSFENSAYPQREWARWSGSGSCDYSSGSGSFITNQYRNSGTQSTGQFLYGLETSWGGMSQEFPVNEGYIVQTSGYIGSFAGSDPLRDGAQAWVELTFLSNRGNVIEKHASSKILGPTNQFLQLGVSGTAPEGAETARFSFVLSGSDGSGGIAYFDDAHAVVIPAPFTPPAKNPFDKPQSTGPVRISGDQILVSGDPFIIKGVCYQPTPVGAGVGEADIYNDPAIYGRDLPLLRNMGANTVRTYSKNMSVNFLNAAYNSGVDPIYVIMGFYIDPFIDLGAPAVRAGLKDEFRNYVNAFKGHPAVLMWSPGNETEYAYEESDRDYFTLLNELAEVAYIAEGAAYHPVTAVTKSLDAIGDKGLLTNDVDMDYLDVWGGNVYEGITFGDMFDDIVHRTQKPFWVSEFGVDTWFSESRCAPSVGYFDEVSQAQWASALWNEIAANTDVCSGGTIFEYSDEWWKSSSGTNSSHDHGGFYYEPFYMQTLHPDNYSSEEWYGIVDAYGNPRKAYETLKDLFTAPTWTLNMAEMEWYQNIEPYSSTGAAVGQMILNYLRDGAGVTLLTQEEIYEYAKSPSTFGPELLPAEVDKVLGHFDPYDVLVSNWLDAYDSLPDGNPYQGYNFRVCSIDELEEDAIYDYMRDICHWMAYTATQEDWRSEGPLAARPNTPAAVPMFGSYDNWMAVKGYAASENPNPDPRGDPWLTPDFEVYGFWIKDPKLNGIGQDTYKTAAECVVTYFKPLATGDIYDGTFLQVAEPPAFPSDAQATYSEPKAAYGNLADIGVQPEKFSLQSSSLDAKSSNAADREAGTQDDILFQDNQVWRDLVDRYLLDDPRAIAAFIDTQMGEIVPVSRPDSPADDYYLVPFGQPDDLGDFMVSGVIILSSEKGYFKEAAWTKIPEVLLGVSRKDAIRLLRKATKSKGRNNKDINKALKSAEARLVWIPGGYSPTPYKPYWEITLGEQIYYVTQSRDVIKGLIKL